MNWKNYLPQLHEALGFKTLNPVWAKVEILLGLLAVGISLALFHLSCGQGFSRMEWNLTLGAMLLFVLGGYLAMAGHRSHLYQSNNQLVAYLIEQIQPGNPRE